MYQYKRSGFSSWRSPHTVAFLFPSLASSKPLRGGSSPLATPPGWRWGSWLASSPLLDGSDLLVELSQELFVGPVLATLVVDAISSGDSASRPSEIHLDPSPAAQQPCQIHLTIASQAWSNVPELTVHCRMPQLSDGDERTLKPSQSRRAVL
ncbi:hypothetical protein CIB48_g8247 [Xylaria polymorpha]|nr:hypothetical protein CIB48_g8247 [Xylaria polymorpha]